MAAPVRESGAHLVIVSRAGVVALVSEQQSPAA
jgi:hypothetical protein